MAVPLAKIINILLQIIQLRNKKSKVNQEMKQFIGSNLELFECPVCFDTIQAPKGILACTNDHYLCSTCHKDCQIQSCPICRDSFEKSKPLRQFRSENVLKYIVKNQ